MRENWQTIEAEDRYSPGIRKECDSRDAHTEHKWWGGTTDWYCPGFLGNLVALLPESKPEFGLGKLPNQRAGFYHIHSGSHECGQAYREVNPWDASDWEWYPCKKLVNHDGDCGYENNTAF